MEQSEQVLHEIVSNQGVIEKVVPQKNGKHGKILKSYEAVAKDGAKVKVLVHSFEHSIFELIGDGFKPKESLNFISTSCGELIYSPIEADDNGSINPIGMAPAVIGESGGFCHVDILRDTDSIHLKFPWGNKN